MTQPTAPQARRIAFMFGTGHHAHVGCSHGAYIEPTVGALIRNGWIKPNGKAGGFPNGRPYDEYVVSEEGLLALELHLNRRRKA